MANAGSFPTTHWSQVAQAAGERSDSQREALEQLLRTYGPAFRAHVIGALRVLPDQADDLVQGFICDRIVAEDLIGKADQTRGKFRTYLLTALDRHVARVRRYELARKRHPKSALANLDDSSVTAPQGGISASDSFDLEWARAVLAQAIDLMRKQYEGGRDDIWRVFEARVLYPALDGMEPTPYPQLVEELKLVSAEVAANLAVTAKRSFARCLRAVVGQYALSEAELEQEIADLRQILAGLPR